MLGDSVAVYLEEGYVERDIPSTIVDATSLVEAGEGQVPLVRILRDGVITREQLEEVLGDLLEPAEKPGDVEPDADDAGTVSAEPGGDPVDQE
jgi:hypothetical protein